MSFNLKLRRCLEQCFLVLFLFTFLGNRDSAVSHPTSEVKIYEQIFYKFVSPLGAALQRQFCHGLAQPWCSPLSCTNPSCAAISAHSVQREGALCEKACTHQKASEEYGLDSYA